MMTVTVVYGYEGAAEVVADVIRQTATEEEMLKGIGAAMQGTTCSKAGEGVQPDGVSYTLLDCEGVAQIYLSNGPMILHDLADGDSVDVAEVMTKEERAANRAAFDAAVESGDLETAAELAGYDVDSFRELLARANGSARVARAYACKDAYMAGEKSPLA